MDKKKVIIGSLIGVAVAVIIYFGIIYKTNGQSLLQQLTGGGTTPTDDSSSGSSPSSTPVATSGSASRKASAPAAATNYPIGTDVYSTGDNVNIRDSPSTSGNVIGQVNSGDLAGETANTSTADWVSIYSPLEPSNISYISRQYARFNV